MKAWNRYLILGVTAAGFAAASIGTAFSAPPSEQGEWECGYGRGPGMDRNQDPAAFHERMKQRINQRQAALHDKLKLNAEQDAAWQKYTAVKMSSMLPPPGNPAEGAKLTAPERMEKMLANMREHENRLASQLDALKAFYATLTPEQRSIFDAESDMGPGRPRRHR